MYSYSYVVCIVWNEILQRHFGPTHFKLLISFAFLMCSGRFFEILFRLYRNELIPKLVVYATGSISLDASSVHMVGLNMQTNVFFFSENWDVFHAFKYFSSNDLHMGQIKSGTIDFIQLHSVNLDMMHDTCLKPPVMPILDFFSILWMHRLEKKGSNYDMFDSIKA